MRNSPIVRSCRDDGARLGDRHQAVARKLAPRAAEAGGARDPDDGLQVAQSAGAFLDVGLEVVRSVVVLEMPLLLLERLRVVERAHVERRVERVARMRRRAGATPASRRCSSRLVRTVDVARHLDRRIRRACAPRDSTSTPMSHSDVEKRSTAAAATTSASLRQQDQHVDVRMREQLAAAVAADGDERRRGGHVRFAPDVADDRVRQPREARAAGAAHRSARRTPAAARRVARAVARASARRAAARRCRRHVSGAATSIGQRSAAPVRLASVAPDRLQSDAVGGGGGVPADCVMIS